MKRRRFCIYILFTAVSILLNGCDEVSKESTADYANEPDEAEYLLEYYKVGEGVFISEYMKETEAFIGQLLMETVENHGEIPEAERDCFSEQAQMQLEEIGHGSLDAGWMADAYISDSFYTLNYLFGDTGYDFSFIIDYNSPTFTNKLFGRGRNNTGSVKMQAFVDNRGIIRGVSVDIGGETEPEGSIAGFYQDEFQEKIIEEGIPYERKVVYDQSGSGLLSMGDAALDAQAAGNFIIDVLESGDVETYSSLFVSKQYFDEFRNLNWNQLDTDWKANCYYDCYYTYVTEERGYVSFTYYIYPDYEQMQAETAKAVIFRCDVGTGDGLICDTELKAYAMTVEEYYTAGEWRGERIAVVKDGEWAGGGGMLRIPGQDSEEEVKYIYTNEDMGTESLVKLFMEDLRTRNIGNGKVSYYLIDKKSTWLSEFADEIHENTDGWKLEETYDFYYLNHNEQSGLIHYKYYFYWNKPDQKNEKVLVTDVWISQEGIKDMQLHWFLTGRHMKDDADPVSEEIIGQNGKAMDIEAYLTIDWTDEDILLWYNHIISPNDSGRGWKFAVADIDFDGVQELFVIFGSNHGGGNSVYIYGQENGSVFSYIDMIATFDQDIEYIRNRIDYIRISPYMDIELLDAYVNEDGEYRYLSLDSNSYGGDIHGGFYTVILYETVLKEDAAPKEIARIEYLAPMEKEELYFLGQEVYETGRLRDMIASYMDGYTKVAMDCRMAEKTFARDVIGLDETERNKELQELYESLRCLTRENGTNAEDSLNTSTIVSDFLSLNAEKFEQKYDRKELYDKDILYCDQNAWKYDGNAVDPYQKPEEHYDVAGITAIRFIKGSYTPGYTDAQANDREIFIQCFDDYAISRFYQKKLDSQSGEEVLDLIEISYIKVETGGEKVSKTFYQELENNYYQVRAEIQAGEWIASPDGTREVCVSNGSLPKHPSQIFVRYRDKMPDSIFRMTWECGIAGWIDDEHIVCYKIDMSGPFLIHLETNQIEEIKKADDDYDIYGAKYEIRDNQLVGTCMGEEIYCWNIVRENDDIRIIK